MSVGARVLQCLYVCVPLCACDFVVGSFVRVGVDCLRFLCLSRWLCFGVDCCIELVCVWSSIGRVLDLVVILFA